jgi:hypothetical protein
MSVFFDGHEDSRDLERRSMGGADGAFLPSFLKTRETKTRETPPPDGARVEQTMRGAVYERLEGVVHLALALTIVAGSALILGTALFSPGAPLGGTSESHAELAAAPEANFPAVLLDPNVAAAIEPDDTNLQASRVDPFLGGQPMAETAAKLVTPTSAPEPLAPPSVEMREKLEAVRSAPPVAEQAPVALAPPPAVETKREAAADAEKPAEAADSSRMSRCYVKLGGRVQMSGSCRVRRDAESVTFDLPGKNLSLSHAHGKTWTATLGGREVGKVYRRGACWGAKHLYVCDNG